MLRFTLPLNGGVVMNEKNHRSGRGFYLCPELVCLKMARKKIVGLDLWTQKSSIFFKEVTIR
jgi:predicted RNA-binding protein YlxR (DUF448 family)